MTFHMKQEITMTDPDSFTTITTTGPLTISTLASAQTTSLVIYAPHDRPIVRFNTDGTIWINPDLAPDEAARQFLDALHPQFLAMFKANQP
jgi:hypothetical protein